MQNGLPAWILGKDPNKRIISVSYSDELASKHARDCRAVMDTGWYKELFPLTRINPNKRTETEYETTKNGYRLAMSVGGTLTGRGVISLLLMIRSNCKMLYQKLRENLLINGMLIPYIVGLIIKIRM